MHMYTGPMTTTDTTEYSVSEWDECPGDTIIIIGCSGAKSSTPAPAADLYQGSFFSLALKAARALVPDEYIRVLSARLGFVTLDTVIDPYDTTWGSDDQVTDEVLAAQFSEFDSNSVVVALTCSAYTARIDALALNRPEGTMYAREAISAFKGSRGIGDHRHHLSKISKFVDDSRVSCPTCGHDMATTWGDGTCVPCNPR